MITIIITILYNNLNDIKTGKVSLEETKYLQKNYNECLNKIRKGNKSDEQKKTFNIRFNERNIAIKFVEDYDSMIFETKRKATEGKRLKILTSKQMLQRLPIAFAQIKAGNNSESVFNEIRQIAYSLCQ